MGSLRGTAGLVAVLVVVAVALLITHFVLDAGSGDSPTWILYVAIAAALGGALVGGSTYGRRR